jgi:DUF218 domain-containing protein
MISNPPMSSLLVGETYLRPARAVELLSQNYAPRMLLDVPVNGIIYDRTLMDIAKAYVETVPKGQSVQICPLLGLSTKTEAQDVSRCMDHIDARRILVVTSDYHTRRARSIFQHEFRGCQIFVTGAKDPQQFGTSWWKNRQWAKVNLDEWLRLVWWELVDRWRMLLTCCGPQLKVDCCWNKEIGYDQRGIIRLKECLVVQLHKAIFRGYFKQPNLGLPYKHCYLLIKRSCGLHQSSEGSSPLCEINGVVAARSGPGPWSEAYSAHYSAGRATAVGWKRHLTSAAPAEKTG